MTHEISTPDIDRFSWSRVRMIASYYYPSLRLQIIFYPLLSVLFGIIIAIGQPSMISFVTDIQSNHPTSIGMISTLAIGLSATVCSFMFYFAPIVFSRRSRDIDVILPALWKEKALFVVLYLFVFIPTAIYAPMFLIRMVSEMIWSAEFQTGVYETGITLGSQSIGLESIVNFLPMSVFGYIIISRPKATFGRAAAFAILTLVAMGLISAALYCIVFYGAIDSAADAITNTKSADVVLNSFSFSMVRYIQSGLCIAATGLMLWLTIRSIKKIQL